jgi:SAM-dependent methyltransferase
LTDLKASEAVSALLRSRWVYAKTMPENPHHYTLRRDWSGVPSFDDVVTFIREYGYGERYAKTKYTYFNANGVRYWTMGAPLRSTILINRATVDRPALYDQLAESYDRLHADPLSVAENAVVVDRLRYQPDEAVLDIGCGTGLLLDELAVPPMNYLGIDPSAKMLARLREKHPEAKTMQCPLEDFWPPVRYDLIVGLFGAPNYITASALRRVPSLLTPGGRYFMMFYGEGYAPVTYERAGVQLTHLVHVPDVMPGVRSELGRFNVIEGGALGSLDTSRASFGFAADVP